MLFRIKDSTFHSDWKIGKVDLIDVKRDNFVRGVSISYKVINVDKDEPRHMVVQRPVKQIVKLFHISDTSLLNDLSLFTTYFSLLYQGLSWRGSIGSWEPINSQKSWENLENRP